MNEWKNAACMNDWMNYLFIVSRREGISSWTSSMGVAGVGADMIGRVDRLESIQFVSDTRQTVMLNPIKISLTNWRSLTTRYHKKWVEQYVDRFPSLEHYGRQVFCLITEQISTQIYTINIYYIYSYVGQHLLYTLCRWRCACVVLLGPWSPPPHTHTH